MANVQTVALILCGGEGKRFRSCANGLPKPLVRIGTLPMVGHVIRAVAGIGVRRVYFLTRHRQEDISPVVSSLCEHFRVDFQLFPSHLEKLAHIVLLLKTFDLPNKFLLLPCDHLFDASILPKLAQSDPRDGLLLAVANPVAPVDKTTVDANRVKLDPASDRILKLGRALVDYDAYDTGAYLWNSSLIERLELFLATTKEEPSQTAFTQMLTGEGRAYFLHLGKRCWINVNTPEDLGRARSWESEYNQGTVKQWFG